MNKNYICYTIITALFLLTPTLLQAQFPEELSDRYIRVAEAGDLTDTLNVWGDVGSSGRYIVPEGIKLPELISFSLGFEQLRGRDSNIDWAKTQIEIKVSRYDESQKLVEVALFRYRYHDKEPVEMFEFDLQSEDIITLQVRKKPAFTDYVGVIAPVVSVIATSILLIENLRGN